MLAGTGMRKSYVDHSESTWADLILLRQLRFSLSRETNDLRRLFQSDRNWSLLNALLFHLS